MAQTRPPIVTVSEVMKTAGTRKSARIETLVDPSDGSVTNDHKHKYESLAPTIYGEHVIYENITGNRWLQKVHAERHE